MIDIVLVQLTPMLGWSIIFSNRAFSKMNKMYDSHELVVRALSEKFAIPDSDFSVWCKKMLAHILVSARIRVRR